MFNMFDSMGNYAAYSYTAAKRKFVAGATAVGAALLPMAASAQTDWSTAVDAIDLTGVDTYVVAGYAAIIALVIVLAAGAILFKIARKTQSAA